MARIKKLRGKVFPAYAGMIPSIALMLCIIWGVPRIRGDDPVINLVCDMIEELPPEMVIHRLTADVPRLLLIAPEWSFRKRTILNGINAELRQRNSWQGSRLHPSTVR